MEHLSSLITYTAFYFLFTASSSDSALWSVSAPLPSQGLSSVHAVEISEFAPLQSQQFSAATEMEHYGVTDSTYQVLLPVSMPISEVDDIAENVNKCYLCDLDCAHKCALCKVATHGAIAGCSKMITEGCFWCLTCWRKNESETGKSDNSPSVVNVQSPVSTEVVPGQKKPSSACPRCGKVFAQAYNLKRHLLKVHQEKS